MSALEFAETGDAERLAKIVNDAQQRASGACAVRSSTGATPLYLASKRRHLACVRLLLEHADDAGVNLRDGHERTALHVALESEHDDDDAAAAAEAVATLLVASPSVDVAAADAFGVTPLHLACKALRLELAAALLSRGARVDAATTRGQTALHWTLARNTANSSSSSSSTTLTAAATSSSSSITSNATVAALVVQLLLANGADPQLADSSGVTPMSLVASDDSDEHRRALFLLLTDHITQKSASSAGATLTSSSTPATLVAKKPVAKKTLQIKLKS
jgi:ankyrin repeat protein